MAMRVFCHCCKLTLVPAAPFSPVDPCGPGCPGRPTEPEVPGGPVGPCGPCRIESAFNYVPNMYTYATVHVHDCIYIRNVSFTYIPSGQHHRDCHELQCFHQDQSLPHHQVDLCVPSPLLIQQNPGIPSVHLFQGVPGDHFRHRNQGNQPLLGAQEIPEQCIH